MGGKDKKLSKKILVGRATAAVQDLGQECAGYFRMWTREGNINPTVQAVTQLSRIKKWSGLVRAAWQGLERRRYCSEVDTWQEILPSSVDRTESGERRMKYQLWRHYYYHESGCDVYINQAQTWDIWDVLCECSVWGREGGREGIIDIGTVGGDEWSC